MLSETKSSSAGAKNKYLNTVIQITISFIFGFLFVVFLVAIGGGILVGKNIETNIKDEKINEANLTTYTGSNFSLSYPENYQFSENKIIGTEDIVTDQKNTIHLISPPINEKGENLSMIITYKSLNQYEKDYDDSSTCPELNEKKLDPIRIGNYTFTHSGLLNCGPNEVAFFYAINNENIYEVKVETTADYESEALPKVLKILNTIKFIEQ